MVVIRKKFKTGQVVCTRGVNELVAENVDFAEFVLTSLRRHLSGDWGNLCEDDRQENERALVEGNRLFSAYKTKGLPRLWVITEADRASTCILFPNEY